MKINRIKESEIQIWITCYEKISDPALINQYHQLLNTKESVQLDKFHFDTKRHQYLVTRALIRTVLSFYANENIKPGSWMFENNQYGKPHVTHPVFENKLYFNLSHSEKILVLAVTTAGEIGVDVECLQRKTKIIELAENYFSPIETQQLNALPQENQSERFYDLWTLKEAYIKACGMGLSIPLNHFSFHFQKTNKIRIEFSPQRKDKPMHWNFWQIQASHSHKIAVAIRSELGNKPYWISMREIIPLQTIIPVNFSIIRKS